MKTKDVLGFWYTSLIHTVWFVFIGSLSHKLSGGDDIITISGGLAGICIGILNAHLLEYLVVKKRQRE